MTTINPLPIVLALLLALWALWLWL